MPPPSRRAGGLAPVLLVSAGGLATRFLVLASPAAAGPVAQVVGGAIFVAASVLLGAGIAMLADHAARRR